MLRTSAAAKVGWNASVTNIAFPLKQFAEKQQLLMVILQKTEKRVFKDTYLGLMNQMFLILIKQACFTMFCLIKLCHLRLKSALEEKEANSIWHFYLELICVSENEKSQLLVLEKNKKSLCFKNVKSLSDNYEADTYINAWMTLAIWKWRIHKLDSQLLCQKRNVDNIVDNPQ